MRSFLLTFALVSVLAASGYSQQVVRDDGHLIDRDYLFGSPIEIADTIPTKFEDGRTIDEVWVLPMYIKNHTAFGWKYDIFEWQKLLGGFLSAPEYYDDEEFGSNNGLVTT